MNADENDDNFEIFRDCLSIPAIAKLSVPNHTKPKKRSGRRQKSNRKDAAAKLTCEGTDGNDLSDLSEFIDVSSL